LGIEKPYFLISNLNTREASGKITVSSLFYKEFIMKIFVENLGATSVDEGTNR